MWTALYILTGIAAAASAWLWFWAPGGIRLLRADDRNYLPPNGMLRLTPDRLHQNLDAHGDEGRKQLRFYLRTYLAFAVLIVGAMAVSTHNTAALAPLRTGMYIASGVRLVCDLCENALLCALLRAFPARRTGAERATCIVGTLKWAATILWVAALFVGLVFIASKY